MLSHQYLKEYFFTLLSDPNPSIVKAIMEHIEVTIEKFAKEITTEHATDFLKQYINKLPFLHAQIRAKSWRLEVLFMQKLIKIYPYASPEEVCSVFFPILKSTLLLSPRQCKTEACDFLTQLLSKFCQNQIKIEILSLVKSLSTSHCYQDRITFLQMLEFIAERVSKHLFKEKFLQMGLALGEDKVISVQIKFCEAAVFIKKNLLQEDIKSIDRLNLILEGMTQKTPCKTLKQVFLFNYMY